MEAWGEVAGERKEKKFRQRNDEISETGGKLTGNSFEKINSDVFYTLSPIYHMSKVCGLLPVKFTQTKSGKYVGRLDVPQVIYSILLLLAFAAAQIWGLYRDLRNGWRSSTRLSSETAITVTCSDVFAVISITFAAILGSAFRWRHVQSAINNIIDVDEKMNVITSKNLRKLSIIVISASYVYLIMLSILDYISWYVEFSTKNLQTLGDKGPINYSPLYAMYIVIVTFEIQYALVLFNIGERFLKLNKCIENLTKANQIVYHFKKDLGLGGGELSETINQLIALHGILCDTIILINKAYGGAILIGTISCLIHLVITPYFLYNLIYSPNSNSWYVLTIQVFWILFHIYRLLLFVQPCYMVAVKTRTTGALVSQALVSNWNPEAKKQLQIFSLQLLQRPVEFTACGLFNLDRTLVTSIVGAVTTYLVILVQFQNADDTKGTKHMLLNATELLKNASTFKNITAAFKN